MGKLARGHLFPSAGSLAGVGAKRPGFPGPAWESGRPGSPPARCLTRSGRSLNLSLRCERGLAQKPSCASFQPRWGSRIGVVLCSWDLRDEGSGWVRGLRFQPTGVSPYPFTVPSARPFASIQHPCVSCPPPLPTRVALAKSLTRPVVLPDRTRFSFRTNTGWPRAGAQEMRRPWGCRPRRSG